ncbi:MAG: sulfatase-like hydrolase/transferase [Kiritimatiellae bacterium]|nr:sulfatase-like hydrolase/transferase [Kiritimatiellia bacterium]
MADRPNILVIMADQHNKRFVGCCGNEIVRTPNLDRLAAEGMRFTRAYCPAPVCVPSRMSFMTGRYPIRNRVWTNVHALPDSIPTWAHVLGAAGYETALIGRMHFAGPDQRHGFQTRPIGEFAAAHPGASRPEPRYKYFPHQTSWATRTSLEWAGTGTTSFQWFDEQVTTTACAYLRAHAAGDQARPFAATVGWLLPHPPFIAPPDLFAYYHERVDVPDVEERQPASVTAARERNGLFPDRLDPERVRVCRAAYYALCEVADQNVGRILDCLEETGLAPNTLVIYCADHGESAGEHGLFWKSNYYEASVGIPLIARLPGSVGAGRACPELVNLLDLGPTFRDIAGSDLDWDADGRSLWSLLRGEQTPPIRETFSELGGRIDTASRMIRTAQWKYWARYSGGRQTDCALFDMDADPDERRDLSADRAFGSVRSELHERLIADWDPVYACRETSVATRNREVLSAWGAAVKPGAPDQIVLPDAELESDFERR